MSFARHRGDWEWRRISAHPDSAGTCSGFLRGTVAAAQLQSSPLRLRDGQHPSLRLDTSPRSVGSSHALSRQCNEQIFGEHVRVPECSLAPPAIARFRERESRRVCGAGPTWLLEERGPSPDPSRRSYEQAFPKRYTCAPECSLAPPAIAGLGDRELRRACGIGPTMARARTGGPSPDPSRRSYEQAFPKRYTLASLRMRLAPPLSRRVLAGR